MLRAAAGTNDELKALAEATTFADIFETGGRLAACGGPACRAAQ